MKKLLLLACTFLCAFSFYGQTSEIQNFTLVDADTNLDILVLEDGMVYDADIISTGVRLNIRANADGVGSVDMKLRGALDKNRTETAAPYALYGDNNGNYFGTNFPLGAYTLTATPYSGPGATGTAGEPSVVNFTFAVQPTAVASANILSGEAPLEVRFTGSNSQNENPDSSLEYLWDFGDGATATDADPTHVFQNPGTYTVQLTTTNVYGFSDTTSLEIVVNEPVNTERPFITTWKTDNPGVSADNQITLMTGGGGVVDYTVDWGDGSIDKNLTGNIVHTYSNAGIYQVSISGDFPSINFSFNDDREKIIAINQWGTINWTTFNASFLNCSNLDVLAIDIPDLSSVLQVDSMFLGCSSLVGNTSFNNWNMSGITDMSSMFKGASMFNQYIGDWVTSEVTDISFMFSGASIFNQDISGWDVSKVTSMFASFSGASSFNQNIGNWDVSEVRELNAMFSGATAFNQDIGNWNVENAMNLQIMFSDASSFNQNLGNWNVRNAIDMDFMFLNTALSIDNYDETLIGWSNLPSLRRNVPLGSNLMYCRSETARQSLIDTYGWRIFDFGLNCPEEAFITTWKTDNPGVSADNQITIPTFSGESYDYTVDWGDGTSTSNVNGNSTHTYASAGVYTVSITGDFPRIFFSNTGDKNKILTVEQWGDIKWTSMVSAFAFCGNLDVVATDAPDFSETTSLSSMFFNCPALVGNSSFSAWDVSTITVMANIFNQASLFNQDISGWNVSNVINFDSMFSRAAAFNQPIGNWNVSRAEDMSSMFFLATSFNQDIGDWTVDAVTDMTGMFNGAIAFNQNIGNWNVGNVTKMNSMFSGIGNNTTFNQDISQWNVSNVESMFNMFANNTAFNQDIGSWNVGNVRDFRLQFSGATAFDQNLGGWDVQSAQFMADMFNGISLSLENYDALLNGWNSLPNLPNNIIFDGGTSQYCFGETARQNLIDSYGWTITDGGVNCPEPSLSIDSFTFVAVDFDFPETSFDAFEIEDGMAYDINLITGFAGNIRANTNPEQVGSVSFSLSGSLTHAQTENVAPYALYGDVNGVYNNTAFFAPGTYTLSAIPYSERNRAGDAGMEETVTFTLGFKPTAIASANVLLGEAPLTVNFTGSNSQDEVGVVEYLWDFGDGVTSNIADPVHTYSTEGTYEVSLKVSNDIGLEDTINLTIEVTPELTNEAFITTWKTDNEGLSEDNQITIPTSPLGEVYNYTVDWGDGSTDTGVTGDMTHTYATPGTYTVSISGEFPRIYFNNPFENIAADDNKIISVTQWGTNEWTSMQNAFAGCENLDILATDAPDIDEVNDFSFMFYNCTSLSGNASMNNWDMSSANLLINMFTNASSFNADIGNWDVSSVTNLNAIFLDAHTFNQDIGNWDVSLVTNFALSFAGASTFNQDIGRWDVGNAVTMNGTFSGARAFNQDIGNWNVASVTDFSIMFIEAIAFNQDIGGWNVSAATDMGAMFSLASAFNQDIGNWNVGNVTRMDSMFADAISFNQDLGSWNVANVNGMNSMFFRATSFDQNLGTWDVGSVTDMFNMFEGVSLSTRNYDDLLIGWSNLPSLQSNVFFGGGNNTFCIGIEGRINIANAYSWTFSDGGANCDDITIGNFTMIDANTDSGLFILSDNAVLDKSTDLNNLNFLNVRANTNTNFSGSIVFALSGALNFNQTESVAPYALFGDRGGDYAGMDFPVGTYTLMATAYSGLGGTGDVVETRTINFTITDQAMQRMPYEVSLSPNAAVTEVNVSVSDISVEVVDILIYDMQGRAVMSYKASQVQNSDGYQLPVNTLAAGTYILTTIDSQGVVNQKQLLVRK